MSFPPRKILRALFGQALAFALLIILFFIIQIAVPPPYPLWPFVLLQGLLASMLVNFISLPKWWRVIQFVLPIALFAALQLHLSPLWALTGFIIMWLIFSNASKEQVPLYLTNSTTQQALAKLAENKKDITFIDLGCGLGGNVTFMATNTTTIKSIGVETAPLPYLIAKIATKFNSGEVYMKDLWSVDLGAADIVYAFLSPEPMPKLWKKVKQQMKAGSIFVSNSFPAPGIKASEIWELSDKRKTKLYVYKL